MEHRQGGVRKQGTRENFDFGSGTMHDEADVSSLSRDQYINSHSNKRDQHRESANTVMMLMNQDDSAYIINNTPRTTAANGPYN